MRIWKIYIAYISLGVYAVTCRPVAAFIPISGRLDVPDRPDVAGLANAQARPYEVWLIDQIGLAGV
jgi:hypothetical protein